MDPLLWAILLLLVGVTLVVVEVFVPSGGVIGVLSIAAVIGSIVTAFWDSATTGATFLGIAVIALPSAFALAVKVWPDTPIGRRILPPLPTSEEVLPDSDHRRGLQELIGKVGRAKSLMLPSGAAEIAGRTVDALSEGVAIEAGQLVRVVDVRGNRVVVRPATDETPTRDPEDPLSQSIEALGLDPFEDPIS
jgi:membrane-bound serine protease (ClpP class)